MATDRTLISIRERPQVDLFDLALAVIRRRPGPLALATLGGVAPFAALNAWAFAHAGAGAGGLGLLLPWVEAPLATAPLTVVLGALMFGRRESARGVARQVARALPTLLLTAGLLRFVPLYWIPPRLAFGNEMILLERSGVGKLWRRGASLVGGRDGDLFLLTLLQGPAAWTFAVAAYLGIGRLARVVLSEQPTWDMPEGSALASSAFQAPVWAALAFLAVVRFLTYIDQRIRLEGWEVELRLRAAGAAMVEGRRW